MILYSKDTDHIVTLTLNMAERSVNVINHEISRAFVPVIELLQKEKARRSLRGVVITSAKNSFLAGGDLEYLYGAQDAAEIFGLTQRLKKIFRDIERPGVPVVAAMNGSALATGFELALACHHRILLDDPKVRVGLPEVQYGLIPGNGGIIRLMWLLGIEAAFPVLANGHRYSPREALAARIVDELVDDERELIDRAKRWILDKTEGRRKWDAKQSEIPGGTVHDRSTALLLSRLTARITKQYHRHFPAPQAILNVLAEGSAVNFDAALEIESRYYTEIVRSREAKNMIKTFWFDFQEIRRGAQRPAGFGRFRPKKVGIIGAGVMGSGLAYGCLLNGMEVVIKDVSKLVAERGRDYVKRRLQEVSDAGALTTEAATKLLGKVQTTEDSRDFETCDLVIEAVFENANVKKKVTREAVEHLDRYSLFASNTVSIPITELQQAALRPENYIGLHFFYPVEDNRVVEVVKGKLTSDETVARAFDFVRAMHKIPVVTKDDWGFYVARVQNTYILEGITMLKEGYAPALIENLGILAGMPKGALALADDTGLPLVKRYEDLASDHYGSKYIAHPAVTVLEQLLGSKEPRPGRRKKAGFYQYPEDGERRLWTELTTHFPTTQPHYDRHALQERLLFAQVLEALWCLQEGVIHSVAEANLGSVHGWGFPAFKGGVIQYIIDYGKAAFATRCAALKAAHGQRFTLPARIFATITEFVVETETEAV